MTDKKRNVQKVTPWDVNFTTAKKQHINFRKLDEN